MKKKICPNWLLCRCKYGGCACHHMELHNALECTPQPIPCDYLGRCGMSKEFGKCIRSDMGGCVEVEEDVNA